MRERKNVEGSAAELELDSIPTASFEADDRLRRRAQAARVDFDERLRSAPHVHGVIRSRKSRSKTIPIDAQNLRHRLHAVHAGHLDGL
jgi:hypothetical protein